MGGAPTGIEDSQGQLIDPLTKQVGQAIAGVFSLPFREYEVLTVDADGRPLTVVYRTTPAGATAFTLTITYDALGNVEKVTQT